MSYLFDPFYSDKLKQIQRVRDAEVSLALLLESQPELWDELKNDLARLGYHKPEHIKTRN